MKNKFGIINPAIGMVSGLIGILAAEGNLRMIGLGVLMIIVCAACLSSLLGVIKERTASAMGPITKVRDYNIRYARPDDLPEIARLQQASYGVHAVPLDLYREWYQANPEGFFVMESLDEKRELVGHFTILAIKPPRLALYAEGEILETEIRGVDLFATAERSAIDNLYVESIIIKPAHRKFVLPEFMRLCSTMIERFCEVARVKEIHAMSATDEGAINLKGFGFAKLSPTRRPARKDGKDMYHIPIADFMKRLDEREKQSEIRMLRKDAGKKTA